MGDYINSNQNDFYWQQQNPNSGMNQNFYEQDYSQFANQQLGRYSHSLKKPIISVLFSRVQH